MEGPLTSVELIVVLVLFGYLDTEDVDHRVAGRGRFVASARRVQPAFQTTENRARMNSLFPRLKLRGGLHLNEDAFISQRRSYSAHSVRVEFVSPRAFTTMNTAKNNAFSAARYGRLSVTFFGAVDIVVAASKDGECCNDH